MCVAVGVRVGVGGAAVEVRVGVRVGVRVAVGGGGVGVGLSPGEAGSRMKTPKVGPVAAGAAWPTGVATDRPVIGITRDEPS